MGISEVFSFSFFILMFSNISLADDCSNSTCSGENPVVVMFPFRLKDRQPEHCGYPGFNLICNSFGKTVMLLPYSGEFLVRQINYVKQEIHFYDSDNCLPRRLLDFNISEFPRFKSVYYQNYTFLNCSSEFEATKLKHIDCLSSKGHNVLATASMTNLGNNFSTECEVIKTVSVPVQFPIAYEGGFSSNLENDLILGWDEPDCWGCTTMGWQCRSVSGNSSQTRCFAVPPHGSSTPKPSNNNDFHNKITLAVALPTVIVVLAFCAWLFTCDSSSSRRRRQVSTTVSPQPPDTDFDITTVGLDGITIESYPKLIIGDSCRVPVPNGNTCPICLNEYYSKEILRSMPDCKHCFHADCIDEWLLINAACPLCRDCPSVLDREPPSFYIP